MSETNRRPAYSLQRLSRRRVIAAGAGTGALALGLVACGGRSKPASGGASTGPSNADGTPKQGGNFNAASNQNPTLDPHRVQGVTNTGISAVMSRVFKFKTGADPNLGSNHELENDLGLNAESPDAHHLDDQAAAGRQVPEHPAGQRPRRRGRGHQGDVHRARSTRQTRTRTAAR